MGWVSSFQDTALRADFHGAGGRDGRRRGASGHAEVE